MKDWDIKLLISIVYDCNLKIQKNYKIFRCKLTYLNEVGLSRLIETISDTLQKHVNIYAKVKSRLIK